MRTAAGILMIIGGIIGGSLWSAISGELLSGFLQTFTIADPLRISVILGFPVACIRLLPLGLAVMGGVFALKRIHWKWALAGAICSLLFPFFGIPAVILLIKSKGEF